MILSIKNKVCESCKNNLDSEVLDRFWRMNSREFASYLVNGGNHLSEIKYHMTKRVDQNYANEVLDEIKQRYRHDIIVSGPLSFWKFG